MKVYINMNGKKADSNLNACLNLKLDMVKKVLKCVSAKYYLKNVHMNT